MLAEKSVVVFCCHHIVLFPNVKKKACTSSDIHKESCVFSQVGAPAGARPPLQSFVFYGFRIGSDRHETLFLGEKRPDRRRQKQACKYPVRCLPSQTRTGIAKQPLSVTCAGTAREASSR